MPPIIKADLPSLLVLAHGGLAHGEAALQPAAFAALQTYPGVGKYSSSPSLYLHIHILQHFPISFFPQFITTLGFLLQIKRNHFFSKYLLLLFSFLKIYLFII